jgi:hypothetical protein
MKIKGESTSVKVLPWDPFATFNGLGHDYIIQIENRVLLSNLKKAELSLKVS